MNRLIESLRALYSPSGGVCRPDTKTPAGKAGAKEDLVMTALNPAMSLPDTTKFTMTAMRLTPDIARHWLEKYNTANRAVSKPTVRKYAAQMEAGRWHDHGAVIKFAPGRMVNGQHTCNAVVESNSAIRVVVLTGVSDELFTVEDTGKKRSASDVLTIEGVAMWQAQTAAAGAHHLLCYANGYPLWSTVKSQNQDIRDFYLERPQYGELVEFLGTLPRKNPALTFGPSAALLYLFAQRDYPLAIRFFSALLTGSSIDEQDAVFHLRKWLLDNMLAGERPSLREQMIATVKAWNCHREGKKVKTRNAIRVRMDDDLPEVR